MTLNLVCFSDISAEAHSVLIAIGRRYVAFIRCPFTFHEHHSYSVCQHMEPLFFPSE